ncbi:MAG: tetratricopeptide repeat protein, partial [Candidatus Marinimicrobia bacterium]|nr:tetratricopeptide repeat protein [Candidatus Neomarinimicrobiota bacterium]
MALSLTKMNDFELAKSYILKAIEIENLSESYTHFSNLGNIYNSLNNHNKAITSFSRSLFIIDSLKIDDPSHYANVMNNLGVTYLNLKDTTTAKNYFNKSINIYKSKAKLSHLNRYPYYNLAKCHLENNPDK